MFALTNCQLWSIRTGKCPHTTPEIRHGLTMMILIGNIPDEDHSQTQIVDRNTCKVPCDALALSDGKPEEKIDSTSWKKDYFDPLEPLIAR